MAVCLYSVLCKMSEFCRGVLHLQVGYLLGLGDRHPSNLMLDRYSGKLLHIDFGDCFEASMHREKFPERVHLVSLAWHNQEDDICPLSCCSA